MTRPNLLFLSLADSNDRMAMSGVPFYMRQALQQHYGNVEAVDSMTAGVTRVGTILRYSARLLGRRRDPVANPIVSKMIARNIKRATSGKKYDFAFVGYGHMIAAYLDLPCPIVYATDSTASLLSCYYPGYAKLPPQVKQESELLERRAISNASTLIYSSKWAADSAVNDYGCPPNKLHVVPFGANIDAAPDEDTVQQAIRQRRQKNVCRLLFVGKDWERKGGDIALETVRALKKMNIPAEITILGCEPPDTIADTQVTVNPGLNKNIPEEAARFSQLFLEADFFLLPTRADCFGIVFAEASAFGVPSITTDTGGVRGVINEGVNGFALPVEASGTDYAACIAGIYEDADRYKNLARSSREHFNSTLNWDAWGKTVTNLLSERQDAGNA